MWTNFGKNVARSSVKVVTSTSVVPPSSTLKRQDSGIGGAQVKKLEIGRQEKITEILGKIRHRDGLPKVPSHVEHLVGRVTSGNNAGTNNLADRDLPGLDLAEKTQLILQSNHPVRHVLEREIYNSGKQCVTYYDWLMLFGRAVRVSKDPKYEDVLDYISRGSDSGMFSSDIHQTVIDIPEDYKPSSTLTQYSLGNKYAVLVGDYFAIRCIYFVEKAKNNKALVAITKGLEQFTTASFGVKFIEPKIIYPIVPVPSASIDEWILYNRKISGYFTGGIYAILVANHDGLPKDEKLRERIKRFSSNLAILLKGIGDVEMVENSHEFSSVPPSIFTSLPAILYQQKNPGVFDALRQKDINFQIDFRQILDEMESTSVVNDAKFILGNLAQETKKSFDGIALNLYYADAIQELVDAVASFD